MFKLKIVVLFYLGLWVKMAQVAFITCEHIIPVELEDELCIEILPFLGGMDHIGIQPEPRIIIWNNSITIICVIILLFSIFGSLF